MKDFGQDFGPRYPLSWYQDTARILHTEMPPFHLRTACGQEGSIFQRAGKDTPPREGPASSPSSPWPSSVAALGPGVSAGPGVRSLVGQTHEHTSSVVNCSRSFDLFLLFSVKKTPTNQCYYFRLLLLALRLTREVPS